MHGVEGADRSVGEAVHHLQLQPLSIKPSQDAPAALRAEVKSQHLFRSHGFSLGPVSGRLWSRCQVVVESGSVYSEGILDATVWREVVYCSRWIFSQGPVTNMRRFVNELTDGEAIQEVYLVADKQLRANRNGNLYLQVDLTDRTGAINARQWNASETVFRSFDVGDFLLVKGKVQLFQAPCR